MPCHTKPYQTKLYHTIPYIPLHCITLHYDTLYCLTLYCITLHYITLHTCTHMGYWIHLIICSWNKFWFRSVLRWGDYADLCALAPGHRPPGLLLSAGLSKDERTARERPQGCRDLEKNMAGQNRWIYKNLPYFVESTFMHQLWLWVPRVPGFWLRTTWISTGDCDWWWVIGWPCDWWLLQPWKQLN